MAEDKPETITDEEFDEMVRRSERNYVPGRLRDIEKWVLKIKDDAKNIRNTPDKKPKKGGSFYISKQTDLDSILQHIEGVRAYLRSGEPLLAQGSLRSLESRVRAVNARLTKPLIKAGLGTRMGGKKGAEGTHGTEEVREEEREKIRRAFETRRGKGKRGWIGLAMKQVAKEFGISEKTVERARKCK